jgi:hypothetical protein
LCCLSEQTRDESYELLHWSGDVFSLVYERPKFCAVLVSRARTQGVGTEHSFKPLSRLAGLVSELRQVLEVRRDMPRVPGDQDGFDTREVLVERGAANPRFFCDLRHGHATQAVVCDQSRRRVEDGVAYLAAVRLNSLVPELWNPARIRHGHSADTLYYA